MTRARENADLPVALTESGGQVGIGTSPAAKLHVAASGNFNQTVRVEDTSVSGRRLDFSYNSTGPYIWVNNSEPLNIYTGGSTRFQIDASGRVTMPNQPMFTVSANPSYSNNPGAAQVIAFNSVQLNQGNHWNTSTHAFTAPIAGNYCFLFSAMTSAHTYTGNVAIQKNNVNIHNSYTLNGSYHRHNINVIMPLAVNDTVRLRLDHGALHGGWDHFSGYLIG